MSKEIELRGLTLVNVVHVIINFLRSFLNEVKASFSQFNCQTSLIYPLLKTFAKFAVRAHGTTVNGVS